MNNTYIITNIDGSETKVSGTRIDEIGSCLGEYSLNSTGERVRKGLNILRHTIDGKGLHVVAHFPNWQFWRISELKYKP